MKINQQQKQTRNNVNQFFKLYLEHLLLTHGITRPQLLTTLSVKEAGIELVIIRDATRMLESKYRTIIEKIYFLCIPVKQVQKELNISHDTIYKRRLTACWLFADNFLELQKRHHITPILDLHKRSRF